MLTHKELKKRALQHADVRDAYNRLEDEFNLIDEFLQARASAGLTQAQVADRIGTTQSAIARLESGRAKRSPSWSTLQKYAEALGCRLELRLVRGSSSARASNRAARSAGRSKAARKGRCRG